MTEIAANSVRVQQINAAAAKMSKLGNSQAELIHQRQKQLEEKWGHIHCIKYVDILHKTYTYIPSLYKVAVFARSQG